jgi:hypothetical protein
MTAAMMCERGAVACPTCKGPCKLDFDGAVSIKYDPDGKTHWRPFPLSAAPPSPGNERERIAERLERVAKIFDGEIEWEARDRGYFSIAKGLSRHDRELIISALRTTPPGDAALREAMTDFAETLQSIVDTKMRDPVQPDDADWQFYALESQRCANVVLEKHRAALSTSPASSPSAGVERVTGCSTLVEEASCLIWAELCPGMVMGDADIPHYEAAAKAVLALSSHEQAAEPDLEAIKKSIRTFCNSLGSGAVQVSHGVERIYHDGISLCALAVAVSLSLSRSDRGGVA